MEMQVSTLFIPTAFQKFFFCYPDFINQIYSQSSTQIQILLKFNAGPSKIFYQSI